MNIDNGPQQTIILNSVVDPRSVFVAIQVCDKLIEAVCDCGASVSCLSPVIFEDLRKTNGIQLNKCNKHLKAANGLPIGVKGIIRVPLTVGNKHYEHEFHVLENTETDCLLGLDFLESNQCDPLFSRMELRLDPSHSVRMYHKTFDYHTNTAFRVVATETTLVPAGHTKILPAHIPNWKRPPVTLNAVFEPQSKFSTENQFSVPNILFNYSEEVIPIALENKADTDVTIYKNTTLGFSEVIPDGWLNGISPMPKPLPVTQLSKYDLRHVTQAIDSSVPPECRNKFKDLVQEYKNVFSKSEWDLGKCDAITHKIEVYPGAKPVKLPNRRMPLHYKQDLQDKLDVFLEKDLIAPCHSPYSAPAMLVPKKNGKLRLVIDYRQLNKQTIKSSWPIPSIEEIFDTLEGSSFFSTIDMSAGFYQVPMDTTSQNFTAFSTPFGSFKWLRMPMGLTGSPNTFQNLMENILVGLTWKSCVPYLDDCIIFSRTPEEHVSRLREVFQRFHNANLKINPAKCSFFQTKVQFLGHIVSKDGLQVDPEKVDVVKKFPIPKTQTEVKSFLGLASYYRRYVSNFAAIARPLHKASETSSVFTWTEEAQDAFETLKTRLTSTPILAFPCLQQPFILYTDASQFAMGAVLAQVQDGMEKAICYASKALSKSQTKYSATRRELLAIVTFTRHFRHYLLGRKFTIVTDHRALQWLHNFKDPDGMTARWLEKLASFDYTVRHRPGTSIGHADGLSRVPSHEVNVVAQNSSGIEHRNQDESNQWEHSTMPQKNDDDHASTSSEEWPNRENPRNSQVSPDILSAPLRYQEIIGDLFHSTDSLAHCVSADFKMSAGIARKIRRNFSTSYPINLDHRLNPLWPQWIPSQSRYIYHLITKQKFYNKPTYGTLRASLERMRTHAEENGVRQISMPCIGSGLDKLEWNVVRQIIQDTFKTSPVAIIVYLKEELGSEPSPQATATDNPLAKAQQADESLRHVREWIRKGYTPRHNDLQGLPRLGWQMYNQLASLYLHEDVLCRKFEPLDGSEPYLQQIIPPALVSEIITSLHNSATAGHLGTYKTIEKIRQRYYWPGFKEDVKKHIRCCDRCQKRAAPPRTHRHSLTDWPVSYPFHHIGLDFLGPLPISNNCQYVLLIGDHFTKWYEAIPLPDQRAETTADALLKHWICRFGCPHSIHTDQGRNFESDLFQQLMRRLEINKTRTTSFHPQSNAVIERMNRTLLNMLAKCIDQNQSDWSSLLPFVLMAYRSSVHESTGFTPYFLVFGHEMSLPLDLMYTPPEHSEPTSLKKQVLERQEAIRKAFELVRRNTTA